MEMKIRSSLFSCAYGRREEETHMSPIVSTTSCEVVMRVDRSWFISASMVTRRGCLMRPAPPRNVSSPKTRCRRLFERADFFSHTVTQHTDEESATVRL
jgi:hypothetical protein